MQRWLDLLPELLPAGLSLAVVVGLLIAVHLVLERRWGSVAGARLKIQVIMLALSTVGLIVVITALPFSDTLRGQILSLIGVLLSAVIALSSTTFVGNAMAGVLLRAVRNFDLGDFVQVGDQLGRVSERGLFHTEIQTPDSDLITLPNLHLVTNPVKVIRDAGTIISAHVSLGYDVPRSKIEERLLAAAAATGLDEPFVHVVELGDFSVGYRVAGRLKEVKQLLSARSRLKSAVLDELHGARIEIVSPTFMNTRAVAEGKAFIPTEVARDESESDAEPKAESVAFDKAEQAEKLDRVAAEKERVEKELKEGSKPGAKAAVLEEKAEALRQEEERLARSLEEGEPADRAATAEGAKTDG